jgi:hypothetical protein
MLRADAVMTDGGNASTSKRGRRIEEAVLEVDGVVRVRVWELPDRVEIGIGVAMGDAPNDVLKRVLEVAEAMRNVDEVWDVGLLSDG